MEYPTRTWVGAALFAGAALAVTSSARAQSCPDAAPLYATRTWDARQWSRALRLSRARAGHWEVSLRRVWSAAGDRCAGAAVEAQLIGPSDDIGRGDPPVLRSVRSAVEVDRRRPRLRVAERALRPDDPRLRAADGAIDVDGDGVAESIALSPGGEGGDEHCGRYSDIESACVACGVHGGVSLTVRSSRGGDLAGPVLASGRARSPTFDAAVEAALRSAPRDGEGYLTSCPRLPMSYDRLVPSSDWYLVRRSEGFAAEALVRIEGCPGWENDPNDSGDACGAAGLALRQVIVEGGRASASMRTVPSVDVAPVTASCAGCSVTAAVPWSLHDGVREPHRLPVTLTAGERAARATQTDAEGRTRLAPGYHAVEVTGPSGVLGVWQVFVAPSHTGAVTISP